MIFFGWGEVIGGLVMGQIIDRFGSKRTTLVNLLIVVLTAGITTHQLVNLEYSWHTFLLTFAWGFHDAAVSIHSQQILGFEFESKSEPFCVYNLV